MKEEAVIFYSWQSDDMDTRNYVENGIKGAIKELVKDPKWELPPRLDRDVQGEVGAVDIKKVIHDKIDKCDVFVGDVSIVDESNNERHLVNQNVMYEVGYAMGKLGEKKIVLLANTDLADPKLLPFDIQGKLVLPFSPKDDPKRKKFKEDLKGVFSAHLNLLHEEKKVESQKLLKNGLIEALEKSQPVRNKAEKYFDYIYNELNKLSPGRYKPVEQISDYAKRTYEAYLSTKDIITELMELLEFAGEYQKTEIFRIAFERLEILTKYFDIVPEDNGQMYGESSEFQELLSYEVTQGIFGVMLKNEMEKGFSEIANVEHYRPMLSTARNAIEAICRIPEQTGRYFCDLKQLDYYSPTTAIYQERWSDNLAIQKLLISGGFYLYLLRDDHYPYSMGLLLMDDWERYAPAFVGRLKNNKFIRNSLALSTQDNIDELREFIFARGTHQIEIRYRHSSPAHVLKKYGINSIDDLGRENQRVSVV